MASKLVWLIQSDVLDQIRRADRALADHFFQQDNTYAALVPSVPAPAGVMLTKGYTTYATFAAEPAGANAEHVVAVRYDNRRRWRRRCSRVPGR
jgi:hypothetical protein